MDPHGFRSYTYVYNLYLPTDSFLLFISIEVPTYYYVLGRYISLEKPEFLQI